MAKGASTALSHTFADSWSTLETLLVDKPPPGEADWHSVFGVDPAERLHGAFNCTLAGDLAHQGRLYVFDRCFGFYSPVFGRKAKLLRADEIVDVRKLPGLLPPAAILIKTLHDEDTVFANFLSRDRAYEALTKVLWNFTDDVRDRPPAVAVGFHTERYLFVSVNAARGPAGHGAFEMHDTFVSVRLGPYEARTPTVENSRAPKWNAVCCFPTTSFDPTSDRVTVQLFDEDVNGAESLHGTCVLPLAGIRAAPPLVGNSAMWRAPASWHKLRSTREGSESLELHLALWTASSAHPAFHSACIAQPLHERERPKDAGGATAGVRVYEEPRLAYLFLEVRQAHGLQARGGRASGMADPFVQIRVGDQQARTHVEADTLNPTWGDTFTFVVEKPLGERLVLDVWNGEEGADGNFMGQVVVPLQNVPLRRGNTRTKPKPRWFRITPRRDVYDAVAGRVLVGDLGSMERLFAREVPADPAEDDGDAARREHLGELEIVAFLDSDYLPAETDRAPVGQVAVEVVRARQLEASAELFAVVRYGRHWVRLPCVSRAPEWRQELVFPVRDMGDVVSVGLFRQHQAWALGAGAEEPLGKARIRPGALLPGKVYRESVPLFIAHKNGVTETGSIDLAVRFMRFSAVGCLSRYCALPLPPKCYLEPPAASTVGALAQWEEELVTRHLASLSPPLPLSVQRFLRPVVDTRLSVRLLRVHAGRVLARFFTDGSAGRSLLDPHVWWQSPGRMAVAHVAYVFLCIFPELVAPLLLLGLAAYGFLGQREAPAFGMDPWLASGAQYDEMVARMRRTTGAAAHVPGSLLAAAGEDEAATADGAPATDGERVVGALKHALETNYDGKAVVVGAAAPAPGAPQSLLAPEEQAALFRLMGGYAKAAQDALEAAAIRTEQITGIFSWRDPLVSSTVFTLLALAGLALFVIPLRSVFIVAGLWTMRHPALRKPVDGQRLHALLGRLSTEDDHLA